jgi:hypothetical protein
MHKILRLKIQHIFALCALFLLSSCALKPITAEYDFVPLHVNDVTLSKLGNGKVLFYNGANILHKIDNTARLNVWINGKALGQIRGREYLIVDLPKGELEVKLHHIDVVNMRSTHTFTLNDTIKIIKVKPTVKSNKLEITNEFPKKFEKFEYAKRN